MSDTRDPLLVQAALVLEDAGKRERRVLKDRRKAQGSEKVPCPACFHHLSFVYDSRYVDRYRECLKCGARYVTEEIFKRRVA
jgi:hydrogenase maturation factor HypF (carbamoyltransferase family)